MSALVVPRGSPVLDRIAARLDLGECWEWTGSRLPRGYGCVRVGDSIRKAHRVLWEEVVGPLSADLDLDHLCRNPACCNPDHLEPVSHRTNVLRGNGPTARNAAATHCKRGHPFDEANTYLWRNSRICRACKRDRP